MTALATIFRAILTDLQKVIAPLANKDRTQFLVRAYDHLARTIATYPAAATQGTVRAIWESLDKPYRAAMDQGLMYTRLGNPEGLAEIQRTGVDRTPPTIR